MEDRRILVVDDEPNILSALGRSLRHLGYRVLKASNGDEGMRLLERHAAPVVLADYNMPGMSGIEFLDRVKMLYPRTARLMLTGRADLEVATQAVNRSAIFKFLTKPWDPAALEADIRAAFEYHALLVENERLSEELFKTNMELVAYSRHLQAQIGECSQRDPLTDLPGRALFLERLEQALVEAAGGGQKPALIVAALNRFDAINQVYGFEAGDALIRAVADRLIGCVPAPTVARFAGGEFAILLLNAVSPRGVAAAIDRVQGVFAQPFPLGGATVYLSLSYGIACSPGDGQTATCLVRHASAAAYEAKRRGGGRCFFTPRIIAPVRERVSLENDLRRAFSQGEFSLFYVPQVGVASGRVDGASAVLYWQHPVRGLTAVDALAPAWDTPGVGDVIGEWMLQRVLGQLAVWQGSDSPISRLGVPVSAKHFEGGGLPRSIKRLASKAGVDLRTGVLELEFSADPVMEESELLAQLRELQDMGVRVALAGLGGTGLTHLSRFAKAGITISRLLIGAASLSAVDQKILAALVALARDLSLPVVADGVETWDQCEVLARQGCDLGRGALFGPPLSAEDLVRRLRDYAPSTPACFNAPDRGWRRD